MTPDLRRQIFELAAQDMPRRQIARTLGLSEGSVRYQLDRPPRPAADPGAVEIPAPLPGLRLQDDPLAEARRLYAVEQLETQRVNLQAQRLEAQKRLDMLQRAPSGDNGAIVLVLDGLKDLRRDLDALKARPAPAPIEPSRGISEQLIDLRQGWEAVRAIGGEQRQPSSETELNVRIALDRLNMEGEERRRKLDFELEERRRQQENDRIRAEAIAQQVQQWAPIIAQGVQTWLTKQGTAPAGAAPAEPNVTGAPALSVLSDASSTPPESLGMTEGPCPNCSVPLRIRPVPGQAENCPRCNAALAVVGGKIWPKLPQAAGVAPTAG